MEFFGISIKGTLRPNIRVLALPLFLISLLFILALVVFKNGFTRISSQIKELQQARVKENILQEKVDRLQQVREVVLSQADLTVVALPKKNPAILMFVQLNSSAAEQSLILLGKEAKSLVETGTDLSRMEIKFETEGEISQIISFLKNIKTFAPLSTIEQVQMESEGGLLTVEVRLWVYWAGFPEKLPPLTQPIRTLTEQEEQVYAIISELTKPEFVELAPSGPSEREDPFN